MMRKSRKWIVYAATGLCGLSLQPTLKSTLEHSQEIPVGESSQNLSLRFAQAASATEKAEPNLFVAKLKAEYLDGLFRAKPHLASFMGDHRFDDKLPDLSVGALAARDKELTAQKKTLAPFIAGGKLRASLPVDDRIDVDILDDGIALELLYLREIKDWSFDPRLQDSFPYYDPREIVAGRLSDVIHGEYAPVAERKKAVAGQLKALPLFLDQSKAALTRPARVYTDQAIKDNKGRIEFFQTEVKDFVGADADIEKLRVAAVAALQGYQTFLEKDLSPRATFDYRLGAALYRKKFPLALQTRLTPEEVMPRARAAFQSAKKELYEVARTLHTGFWPKEPAPAKDADEKTQAQVINRVKSELSQDHPRADELVKAHAEKLDGLRAFIKEHDLLTVPPRESLRVKEMPAFKRGAAGAEYLAPGVLEKSGDWHATYYVDPVDPSWPAEKTESYLRSQNNLETTLTAAHEAYPGHHTQFFYERRDLNPLRAVLWNPAFAEGWAVYGESLLTRLGLGGPEKNLGLRFYDLRGHMIVAANIMLDIQLQGGTMTDEEALRFMVDEGFQERTLAEKKLLRAKLDSTQLAQYFLGFDEITELEKEARQKLGGAFTQRGFDESIIGHGSIAVRHLKTYMLGD